jgi:hypothetical protein
MCYVFAFVLQSLTSMFMNHSSIKSCILPNLIYHLHS